MTVERHMAILEERSQAAFTSLCPAVETGTRQKKAKGKKHKNRQQGGKSKDDDKTDEVTRSEVTTTDLFS
jgi:hypothetical protein